MSRGRWLGLERARDLVGRRVRLRLDVYLAGGTVLAKGTVAWIDGTHRGRFSLRRRETWANDGRDSLANHVRIENLVLLP